MPIGFNPWILVGAIAVASATSGVFGYVLRGHQEDKRAAIVAEAQETAQQKAIADALAAQKAEHDRVLADAIAQEKKAAQRKREGAALEKDIRDAPVTEACAGSPAIRRSLDGLRALEAARANRND